VSVSNTGSFINPIKHGTYPVFVAYHEKDEVDSSVAYGDEFLAPDLFR